MTGTILVTGATGALGPHLLCELLRDHGTDRVVALMRPDRYWDERCQHLRSTISRLQIQEGSERARARLEFVEGDLTAATLGLSANDATALSNDVTAIVHAGASTRFTAPLGVLRAINVGGTERLLDFARRCRRLEQFLLVSTVCVAGTRTGDIAEEVMPEIGSFVNDYERTKHEAELLVAGADLPVRIARLSVCLGHRRGYVHRFGAVHQCFRWIIRGLVPIVPGSAQSRVDLIATDVAARWIARAVSQPVSPAKVHHVAAGAAAAPLSEFIQAAVEELRLHRTRWIEAPLITDADTFALFEASVAQSGDPVFARICSAAGSFFPMLLHPKVYQTRHAESVWGGPLPVEDWHTTLRNVIAYGCARDWHGERAAKEEYA